MLLTRGVKHEGQGPESAQERPPWAAFKSVKEGINSGFLIVFS